ncbi:MAG: NAD-dependent deacylase [Syntrophorhabdales bacterium]
METSYKEVARIIREKGNVVAFTGAGISVESGIPAFRGGQGLWEKYDPMEYAQIGSFMRSPDKVWSMLREMGDVILRAEPSPAHKALGALEKGGLLNAVITQNVDGLHQIAGNTNVIEYHGNHRRLVCLSCSRISAFTEDSIKAMPYPVCERCQEALKPDVVFFGEQIPATASLRASQEALACKVLIIIGTSGVVYPAAEIPFEASAHGATVVEINVSPTPFTSAITHHFLEGSASEILPAIVDELGLARA